MKSPTFSLAFLAFGISSVTAFDVHEWGTFTTVSGSDGILLEGLQREEESLPPFVHSHLGLENGQISAGEEWARLFAAHGKLWTPDRPQASKGLGQRPVSGVTVKMETPVIYFHSDKALAATVKVGFNGGTISQWYPRRSAGDSLPEPAPPENPKLHPTSSEAWRIDFSKGFRGAIEWKIDVLSPSESRDALVFKPRDTVNWIRARVPEANAVRTGDGEIENYLFYRGIGRFETGMKATITGDETIYLHNGTGARIPFLLVFEQNSGVPRWRAIDGGIESGADLKIPESSLVQESTAFPGMIYRSLHGGLVNQGLLPSEAAAMVQTWWTSYFEAEGLRVFWVVPRSVTDRILPLEIVPAPDKITRVIVGRSELLRPRLEARFLANSRAEGEGAEAWKNFVAADRFGIAYRQRVAALGEATATTGRPRD